MQMGPTGRAAVICIHLQQRGSLRRVARREEGAVKNRSRDIPTCHRPSLTFPYAPFF